jgi:glycyl-tRNA synthetase beta chain
MGKELLFEIGTEEIPSGYLPAALEDLKAAARRLLAEQRLACDTIRTLGTPRRLTLVWTVWRRRQVTRARSSAAQGGAFDAEESRPRLAEGSARAQESVESQQVRAGARRIRGRCQEERAAALRRPVRPLPKVLGALSFPKFMRWGEGTIRFVRPIRWLLAIFDGRVVPFEMDGLKADGKTYGHRFLAPRGCVAFRNTRGAREHS